MEENEKKKEKKKNNKLIKLIWVIVLTIAILAAARYSIRAAVKHLLYVTTDDAFIEGHIISISPKASGYITQVLVNVIEQVGKRVSPFRVIVHFFNIAFWRDQSLCLPDRRLTYV